MDRDKPNINRLENISAVWQNFANHYYREKTYALLYASNRCFLGLIDKHGNIEVQGKLDIEKTFEARIFNPGAELRWLKGFGEKIITESSFPNSETIAQKYLIWGEKIRDAANPTGWTQFGSARIGAFYVPIEDGKVERFAQFEAVEYLMSEDENGNVFVADERLTGISEVK